MTNDKAEMRQDDLKKYLSDFDNLSETGFFSSAFIDDNVFYHKGLTLWQFLQVGREFVREYSMLDRLSELQPVNPDDEKAAEEYASKDFQDKSSWEYHNQYTSYLAGRKSLRGLQPVNKTDGLSLECLKMRLDEAKNTNVRNEIFDWLLSKRSVGLAPSPITLNLEQHDEIVQDIEGRLRYMWSQGEFGFNEVAKSIASILPRGEAESVRDEIEATTQYNRFVWMSEHLQGLKGKTLACFCKLEDKCHGDVLIEFLNESK